MSGGRKSPSGQYTTWVWAYGSPGESFTNISVKTLEVYVSKLYTDSRAETVLYHRSLSVRAGQILWESEWSGDSNVVIEISENGNSHEAETKGQRKTPPLNIRITLCQEPVEGKFIECNH